MAAQVGFDAKCNGPGPSGTGDKMPRVSIGVPVYNGSQYIQRAVESFLRQTFDDLEIVISDNASTDETGLICRKMAEAEPRIRYFRAERNLGARANYNRVFDLSRGEYFKWAAHDDACAPSYVEKCVTILDGDPTAVLCHSRSYVIDELGTPLREHIDNYHLVGSTPSERLRHAFLAGAWVFHPVFGLARRRALERTSLIGNYVGSDYVLLAELAMAGRCYEIPEFLFYRRQHPGRSGNLTLDQYQQWWDPNKRAVTLLHHWRLFAEYIRAVQRARQSLIENGRCTVEILKWFNWHRWHLARDLMRSAEHGVRALRSALAPPGRQ